MTSAEMNRFKEALRRQFGSSDEAGISGEDLTRLLLNHQEIAWFCIEQGRDTKSRKLTTLGAKRVDFVVSLGGASILLDAKCMFPTRDSTNGSVTYALEKDEIDSLTATGKEFGLDVAVIFWDRKAEKSGQSYVIDSLSRLNTVTKIHDKQALSATFTSDEISTVQLI